MYKHELCCLVLLLALALALALVLALVLALALQLILALGPVQAGVVMLLVKMELALYLLPHKIVLSLQSLSYCTAPCLSW